MKIAILGHPRSGSTWLSEVFSEEYKFGIGYESYTKSLMDFHEFTWPHFSLPASAEAIQCSRDLGIDQLSTKEVYFYNKIEMLKTLGYESIFCVMRDLNCTIFDEQASYKSISYSMVIYCCLKEHPELLDPDIQEVVADLEHLNRLEQAIATMICLRVILYRNCKKHDIPIVNYNLFFREDEHILAFLEQFSNTPCKLLLKIKESRFAKSNLDMRKAISKNNGIQDFVNSFVQRHQKSLTFGLSR